MSSTTTGDDLDARLARRRKQLELARTNAELRALSARRRAARTARQYDEARAAAALTEAQRRGGVPLTEDYGLPGDWLSGYSDILDRVGGPDSDFLFPISVANDVRYGDNWPFWRTWMEHARLRASSRLIYGMSPLVRGSIRGVGAYVVGDGMRTTPSAKRDDTPRDLLDAVGEWFKDWEKDNNWLARQRECFVRHQRDGEYFIRIFPQEDGWTVVRLVEPMHVVDAPGMPRELGSYGVLTDPEDLLDVRGFWVALDGSPGSGERVSSKRMKQHKANVDENVKRGAPTIAYDMLKYFKLSSRLLENLGTGAAIQAAIAFIRQHAIAPASAVGDFVSGVADYDQTRLFKGNQEYVQRFEPGTVIDMDAGQEFKDTAFASNVQNFSSAVQAMLRAVAVNWNAPEWITSADSSGTNYSSSLTAESPFVRNCKASQGEFAHVFQWAAESALRHHCRVKRGLRIKGRLYTWEAIEHYVDLQVTPPTVETRDRQQEASLNKQYLDMGVKSPQTIAGEIGVDFEREDRNIKQFKKDHPDQGQGGGGGDPMAAMMAGMGGGGEPGAEGGEQPAPEGVDATPDAAPDAAPDAGGDPLADAGLGDLFDGLGIEDTPADEGEGGEAPADQVGGGGDLRATVGALDAVRELQAAVYGGELPREAAIANAKLMLGFSEEEAASLFPAARPVNTQDAGEGEGEQGQGGGADPQAQAREVLDFVESVMGGRARR